MEVDVLEDANRQAPQAPDMLVRFVNTEVQPVDKASAWAGMRLIVDGTTYGRRAFGWAGVMSKVPRGHGFGGFVHLSTFVANPPPGRHQVTVEIAGHRSREITLMVPEPSRGTHQARP